MSESELKVLIVDDYSTMRRILSGMLRRLGYHAVVEAEDGDVAIAILRRQHIDVVVTDWNMPNMSGLELLKAIRADDGLQHLPVLVVINLMHTDQIAVAVEAGMNGYIIKPFTREELREKMDAILGRGEDFF